MVERVVYVLGAGASYDAGGPLTRDFFERNRKYDEGIYERHFCGNRKYQMIESIYNEWKFQRDSPSIEEFFNEVAARDVYGSFIVPSTGESVSPGKVRDYLVWYMSTYIHRSCCAQRTPPRHYLDFVNMLKKRGRRSSIVTFNYDLVFDSLLFKLYGSLDYGFSDHNIHTKPRSLDIRSGIPLMKLHGSLNWTECEVCGRIDVHRKSVAHLERRKRCTGRCSGFRNPIIVPPMRDKEKFLGSNNPTWMRAYVELCEADRVVLIGYSVPEADLAARDLLSRTLTKENPDAELVVVTNRPDTLRRVEERLGRRSSLPNATPFKQFVAAQMS